MPKGAHIGAVVKECGLSASTWRRLAALGHVRCVRIRGRRVFDLDDCHRVTREGVQEPEHGQARRETHTDMRALNKAFRERHAVTAPSLPKKAQVSP